MKKETLIWQIMIFVLGLIFVLTVREYLLDKNEIEAEIGVKECSLEHKKAGLESNYCQDIGTYKLKFNK
jgi:hypothetical protein